MARTAKGPTLNLRGAIWFYNFTGPNGKRHKGTTNESDKSRALDFARERYTEVFGEHFQAKEAEASEGKVTGKNATLGWAIDRVLEHRRTINVSAGTLESYRVRRNAVQRLIAPETLLRDITSGTIHDYVRTRTRTPPIRGNKAIPGTCVKLSTVWIELVLVEMALRLARAMLGDSSSGIPKPQDVISKEYRVRPHRTLWLDQEQATRLVDYFRKGGPHKRAWVRAKRAQGDYDCLVGWLYTGARAQELFRIQARHWKPAEGVVFIDGTKTPKSKRWVPVAPVLAEVLNRRCEGLKPTDPVFPRIGHTSWADDRLTPACEALGLPRISVVHLRHTYASILINQNVSSRVVAECLGHTTSALVEKVYGHLAIRSVAHLVTAALPGF